MDDISRIAIEDAVGVLTIDSPPVNALGTAVRRALVSGITQLTQDDTVSAIVIQCAGRTFFAGADISEFGKPPQSPNLPEVLEHIENCPKPVIAAIHGTALGGGYELALNCHYRIAVPSAKVGLPEVKLGLLPGAGGTQRLPRLVGPKIALELIVNGDPVPAPKALELGMIDALADEGQLHRMAVEYARSVVAQNLPLYRVRDRGDKIAPGSFDPKLFDEFRRANASAMRGFKAPEHIIRAIEAAVSLPFDDGIARERALFGELRESPESDAQRYYFFAKRKADKSFANSDASEDIVADRMRKALADQAEAAISGGTSPRQIDDVLYDYGFPPDYLQTIGVNPGNAPASGATAKADESLLTSLLFSVAKEGARMLEQGIVPHASDIDVAAIHCCHWPVYKGGPMFWADRAGAPKKAAEPDRARAQFDQSEVN